LYCHSPPLSEDKHAIIDDEEYQRETLLTAIKNTNNAKKLQKLKLLEAEANQSSEIDDDEFDDFGSILGDSNGDSADNGQKRGKAHKSIKVSYICPLLPQYTYWIYPVSHRHLSLEMG
jgi:hypothetical protein